MNPLAATAAISWPISDVTDRAVPVLGLLAAACVAWGLLRLRDGRFRQPVHGGPAVLDSSDLGRDLGERATFVQFSAAGCSPCPHVRRVLADVAASEPGVVHVELAAEEHMDLVRRLGVLRTPTVMLLDPDGAVRSRTSGLLRPEQARAALGHQYAEGLS